MSRFAQVVASYSFYIRYLGAIIIALGLMGPLIFDFARFGKVSLGRLTDDVP